MIRFPRPTLVTLILAASCLLLIAISGRLALGAASTMARTQPAAMAIPQIPPAVAPAGATANILRRPVFHRDRKPVSTNDLPLASSGSSVAPSQFTDLVLQGIVLAGASRRAGFSTGRGTTTAWVDEGDEFNGWRVIEVLPDQVRLSDGSREEVLRLYERNEE